MKYDMNRSKLLIGFFLILIVSAVTFYTFYKDVHLLGGLKINFDKSEIQKKAEILVNDMHINIGGTTINAKLVSNDALVRQVQEVYGFKKGNDLLRSSLPGFYWRIKWDKAIANNIVLGSSEGSSRGQNNTKLEVEYDNYGNLLNFDREISDSVQLPTVSPQKAKKIVKEFLSRFGTLQNLSSDSASADTSGNIRFSFISGSSEKFDFKIERTVELPRRKDYQYTWSGNSAFIKDKIEINVNVAGNIVSKFNLKYIIPEKYTTSESSTFRSIITILFYVFVLILIAYLSYKKIKAGEIGFRLAFLMGLAVALSFGFFLYSQISEDIGWAILIPIVLGPLLYGGALFITWAVSESISRETWKEKFLSLDLLSNGYFTHSKVGEVLVNGIGGGLIMSILWLFMLFIVQNFTSIWSIAYDTSLLDHFNSYSPAFGIINKNIYSSIFMVAVFYNFLAPGIKRRWGSKLLIILGIGIPWGIIVPNHIHPLMIGISIQVVIGIFLALLFLKFDVLTVLISLISFYSINSGLSLFTSGHPTYIFSGYELIGFACFLIILAVYSLYSKDKIIDYNKITPAFAGNITERQRLQRELEIAKDVQMSFLPSVNPRTPGLDVAARCIPALEVGGDYFDFIEPDREKFGVIVGDVSGKGTQAAFYMTLTKGFLKAISKTSSSPLEVLKQMNSLFYENVERGTFISMIYGVFDKSSNVLRLARAGHNPLIYYSRSKDSVTDLYPPGMALGLEKGEVFNSVITETVTKVEAGDVFVFYTDGFSEAMNKSGQEFGEDRLWECVTKYSGLKSEQIVEKIFGEAKNFMGKAEQHDDMSIVVVKIG